MSHEKKLICEYADAAANIVTRKTIRALKGYAATLSGDDSGLASVWEEICVQIQSEDSFYRNACDELIQSLVSAYVAELPERDLRSLWLQTDDGWNWYWDIENPVVAKSDEPIQSLPLPSEIIPYDTGEIVVYIVRHILLQAGTYSNRRIRAFLDYYA